LGRGWLKFARRRQSASPGKKKKKGTPGPKGKKKKNKGGQGDIQKKKLQKTERKNLQRGSWREISAPNLKTQSWGIGTGEKKGKPEKRKNTEKKEENMKGKGRKRPSRKGRFFGGGSMHISTWGEEARGKPYRNGEEKTVMEGDRKEVQGQLSRGF